MTIDAKVQKAAEDALVDAIKVSRAAGFLGKAASVVALDVIRNMNVILMIFFMLFAVCRMFYLPFCSYYAINFTHFK